VAQLLVRNLDDDVKEKLERRAARHGRSTAEEVRDILRNAVRREDGAKAALGSRLASTASGSTKTSPSFGGSPRARRTSGGDPAGHQRALGTHAS
jgi:plasmid stability protein